MAVRPCSRKKFCICARAQHTHETRAWRASACCCRRKLFHDAEMLAILVGKLTMMVIMMITLSGTVVDDDDARVSGCAAREVVSCCSFSAHGVRSTWRQCCDYQVPKYNTFHRFAFDTPVHLSTYSDDNSFGIWHELFIHLCSFFKLSRAVPVCLSTRSRFACSFRHKGRAACTIRTKSMHEACNINERPTGK